MSKKILMLPLLLLCAGCAAAWGQTYQIMASDGKTVAIKSDPVLASEDYILKIANNECKKAGRTAYLTSISDPIFSPRRTVYSCQ